MHSKSLFSKKTYGAMGMLALLSTTACDNPPFANKGDDATGKGACASVATSAGVKAALFGKSRKGNPGAEARISELEQGSVARLEQPVVDQVEQQTEKTTCSATLVLSLPPGSKASKGIDEEQKIRIRYSVQPSADGNGIVYEVFGGDALADALAGKQPAAIKTAQPNTVTGQPTATSSSPPSFLDRGVTLLQWRHYVILASAKRQAGWNATKSAQITRCLKYEPATDSTYAFEGLAPDVDFVHMGGYSSIQQARQVLAWVKPCAPDAYIKRAKFLFD